MFVFETLRKLVADDDGDPISLAISNCGRSPPSPHAPSYSHAAMAFFDLAQYFIYFTSAFIFIPGTRDILAPGKPIMPGDEKLISVMQPKPAAIAMLWNTWGFTCAHTPLDVHCAPVPDA